ncbi:MAG TPA: winged helix-turn-helix domain-containing protein [Pyrinomonadaceae bacterium]|nr:winged helix-turn-helix domain-containing protein [Pyrinomonadaceae bacterium]
MPLTLDSGKIYLFEEFRLEPEKRVLIRNDGEQIRLANRPFQILLYLIENRDRLVKRDELLEKFWDGRDVYDTALTKAVGAIRRGLEENPENPRFIETRWTEGYRFIGKIEEQPASPPSFVEIEKTREVRLVIEDSNENGEPLREKTIPARTTKQLNPNPRFRLKTAAAAVGLILVIILSAFVFLRPQQKAP